MKTSFVRSKYVANKFVTLSDRSLFITGGREEQFGGRINWFLGEQKEGSVVTEKPKGGITENFGRRQRGTTQICLENQDIVGGGGGGGRDLLGGITSVK